MCPKCVAVLESDMHEDKRLSALWDSPKRAPAAAYASAMLINRARDFDRGPRMERLAGRIILLWGWRRALAAFAPGRWWCWRRRPTISLRSASSPFRCWSGCWTAHRTPAASGFLRRLRPAFAIGWWFGFGYFLAGLWWIGGALLVEAESFAWALPFAVRRRAGHPGLLLRPSRRLWRVCSGPTESAASPPSPSAFGAGRMAPHISLHRLPVEPGRLRGDADAACSCRACRVVGMAGMNALAVFVFSMPALLAGPRDRRLGLAWPRCSASLHVGFGYLRLAQPLDEGCRTLTVRIVQPSIDMSEKWDAS